MFKNIVSILAKGPQSYIGLAAGKENLSCRRSQLGIPGSVFWEQREGAGRKGPLPPNQRLPVKAPMETSLHPG